MDARPVTASRALFLDRDGVINVDHGYVHRIEEFDLLDGIFELIRAARARGYAIVVVTNQAGIGRGYYGEEDFQRLSAWMLERFEREGARIDRIYHCPDHPEGVGVYRRESPMRKPQPGMLLQAARDLALDLGTSVLVGDKETDIEAGLRAGLHCTILLTASETEAAGARQRTRAAAVVHSLRMIEPYL